MKKYLLLVPMLALLLSGCMNPYSMNYQDQSGGGAIYPYAVLQMQVPAQVVAGTDQYADNQNMLEQGYIPLGYSSFTTTSVGSRQAVDHGMTIGASVIITYRAYRDTQEKLRAVKTPDTTVIVTETEMVDPRHRGHQHENRGHGATEVTRTVVEGETTTYVPYNVDRFDYVATFWAKSRGSIFGAHVNSLTADQHRAIGRNQGVVITAIIRQTPAYNANFFAQDILLKIGTTILQTPQSYSQALMQNAGQMVTVEFIRNNQIMSQSVQLSWNPYPTGGFYTGSALGNSNGVSLVH